MSTAGRERESSSKGCIVRVVYLPPLSDLVGDEGEEILIPEGSSLADLIRCLEKRHGGIIKNLFYKDGKWDPQVGIAIKGRLERDPVKELPRGAEITFLPVLAGG